MAQKKLERLETGNGEIRGTVTLAEDVVASIGGMATRDVPGISQVGKSKLISFGGNGDIANGVEAEVGSAEVAFDIDVIIEHGCDVRKTAEALRKQLAKDVAMMADRKVVEVNLNVIGIEMPAPPQQEETTEQARVH
jgi:uncharacterized alkaline shock family protein YloU